MTIYQFADIFSMKKVFSDKISEMPKKVASQNACGMSANEFFLKFTLIMTVY